jgi:hypothetical protein
MLSVVRNHLASVISVRKKARRVSSLSVSEGKNDNNESYEEIVLTHRFPSEQDILGNVEVNLQMLNGYAIRMILNFLILVTLFEN